MHWRRHIAAPERAAGGALGVTARHDASVDRQPAARGARNGTSLVNAGWIVLAVAVLVAVLMLAASSRRRHEHLDLGTVSDQWMAEQRLGRGHDPQR
jgi:hypothetical protein